MLTRRDKARGRRKALLFILDGVEVTLSDVELSSDGTVLVGPFFEKYEDAGRMEFANLRHTGHRSSP